MAIIETQDLTKFYQIGTFRKKDVVGLNKVNLRVEEGEIFGILGPNGSGKTTCLKILLGLLFPTSGKALILGKDPFDVGMKEQVGFLPENPYYYDYLTGEELLRLYGSLYRMPPAKLDEQIERNLDLVALQDARKLTLRQYSKGMLERIGLAASLIHDPRILILDEPTTGLDPIGCKQTRDLLLKLKQSDGDRQGKTILLCSHFLSEVERVCDRIAIFHMGNLLATGTMPDLIAQYGAENLEDLFVKVIESYPATQQPVTPESQPS